MARIEHVAWQVDDPAAVAQWYVSHLGFNIQRKIEGPPHTHFLLDESGHFMVEVYHHPKTEVPDYTEMHPLTLHLAIVVEDAPSERDRLAAAGATIEEDMIETPDGDQIVMMKDPWGFTLQLVKRADPML